MLDRVRPGWIATLSARQVNLLLELLVAAALITGLTSWAVGTGWSRWWTAAHGIIGLTVVVVTPVKFRRSVRPGLRRRRAGRWLSVAFGGLVLGTIAVGVAHATGLWFGVGYWSALWLHFLAAFTVVPLLFWHVLDRPYRATPVDLDRRFLLGSSSAVAAAAAIYGGQELFSSLAGTAGADRRSTGSHERGSFDPDTMPTTVWFDDSPPVERSTTVEIEGRPVTIDELWALARPVTATIDCTGGWFATQRWDAVALGSLLDTEGGRSVRVTSTTGYSRLLASRDVDDLFLAVGYDGAPLRRGHGAPVRLVAPGRRGFWWVKWVTSVEVVARPWWLQLPFPPT